MKTPEEIKKSLECCAQFLECRHCPYNGEKCTVESSMDALAYIQQLERERDALEPLENQPKWISVEERLPEIGDKVLFAIPAYHGTAISIAERVGDDIWLIGNMRAVGGDPTHWMPLPEPPKEDT